MRYRLDGGCVEPRREHGVVTADGHAPLRQLASSSPSRWKQLYPDIAAGDLYSLQLRAYMPVAYKHIRRAARAGAGGGARCAHAALTSSADSSERAQWHFCLDARLHRGAAGTERGRAVPSARRRHVRIHCLMRAAQICCVCVSVQVWTLHRPSCVELVSVQLAGHIRVRTEGGHWPRKCAVFQTLT